MNTRVRVRPSLAMKGYMLFSIALLCLSWGSTAYVWSVSVYDCIDLLEWSFCGSEGQADLIYWLTFMDFALAFIVALPFINYSATKFVIQAKNNKHSSKR